MMMIALSKHRQDKAKPFSQGLQTEIVKFLLPRQIRLASAISATMLDQMHPMG
jgi:hypothetical protein